MININDKPVIWYEAMHRLFMYGKSHTLGNNEKYIIEQKADDADWTDLESIRKVEATETPRRRGAFIDS